MTQNGGWQDHNRVKRPHPPSSGDRHHTSHRGAHLHFREAGGRTNASGFFLARGEWLFLVTRQHALYDAPGQHFPDRIGIELHTDPDGLAEVAGQAPGTSGMTRRIAFV